MSLFVSAIFPAADGDKILDLTGSSLGLAPGSVEWQCELVARVWHRVTAAAPVGSWASVGGRKEGLAPPSGTAGPRWAGTTCDRQQLSGLGISDMGARVIIIAVPKLLGNIEHCVPTMQSCVPTDAA